MADDKEQAAGSGGKELERRGDGGGGEARGGGGTGGEQDTDLGGVMRDMAIGALAGAAIGAAWHLARTFQPERTDEVKSNVTATAREIGAAAGAAVRDTLASRPMNEVVSAMGEDGKRGEAVKNTLRDAAAAAGDAAREVLESKGSRSGSDRDE